MNSGIASGIGYIIGGISLIGGAIYYNYRKKSQSGQNEQKQNEPKTNSKTNSKKPGLN